MDVAVSQLISTRILWENLNWNVFKALACGKINQIHVHFLFILLRKNLFIEQFILFFTTRLNVYCWYLSYLVHLTDWWNIFFFGFQNFDFEVDEKAMFVNYGMTICGEYTDIKLYNSAAVNSKVHNSIGIMQSNSYRWLMRSLDIAMQ